MPQKSRSRLGFLSGYASRRIAMGSEWRRSMCARMRRTIAGSQTKESFLANRLFTSCRFAAGRHVEMNAATLSHAPLIES